MSLISRLKAVVAGDDYLDDDFDDLDYASEDELNGMNDFKQNQKNSNVLSNSNPCLLYTSPSPRDLSTSRMPSSA